VHFRASPWKAKTKRLVAVIRGSVISGLESCIMSSKGPGMTSVRNSYYGHSSKKARKDEKGLETLGATDAGSGRYSNVSCGEKI
jgi:hypothetical protein